MAPRTEGVREKMCCVMKSSLSKCHNRQSRSGNKATWVLPGRRRARAGRVEDKRWVVSMVQRGGRV